MSVAVVDRACIEEVRGWLAERALPATATNVARALRALPGVRSPVAGLAMIEVLRAELSGAGPIQPLLADQAVTDVLVQAGGEVWIDRGRGMERAAVRLPDEAAVRALAVRIVAAAGHRLDAAQPFADAVLPDGHRVHAIVPPVAVDGTCLSLRVLRPQQQGLAVLTGAMPPGTESWLRAVLRAAVAVVVTGATGAGKTTLLGAMLDELDRGLRIVTVEDTPELHPAHPHVVRLRTRAANAEQAGAIGLRALLREALRMRPDRLVLGEVRGAEVIDLLVALNTGHSGGLCTLHANAAAEVPARIEALAALGGLPRAAAHSLLAPALRVVVHLERDRDTRRVAEIALLEAGTDGFVRSRAALEARGGALTPGPGYDALVALVGEPPR